MSDISYRQFCSKLTFSDFICDIFVILLIKYELNLRKLNILSPFGFFQSNVASLFENISQS